MLLPPSWLILPLPPLAVIQGVPPPKRRAVEGGMNTYTMLGVMDTAAAVEALPAIP